MKKQEIIWKIEKLKLQACAGRFRCARKPTGGGWNEWIIKVRVGTRVYLEKEYFSGGWGAGGVRNYRRPWKKRPIKDETVFRAWLSVYLQTPIPEQQCIEQYQFQMGFR